MPPPRGRDMIGLLRERPLDAGNQPTAAARHGPILDRSASKKYVNFTDAATPAGAA